MNRKRLLRIGIWFVVGLFILFNFVVFNQAYQFTHFTKPQANKEVKAKKNRFLSMSKTILFGIKNYKPLNDSTPALKYETIRLNSRTRIECWMIKAENSKGTVIMFPGFQRAKSRLIERASIIHDLGYNTLLVDFMSCGGSEGTQTTIGIKEAKDVVICYNYIKAQNEKNIILFGTSMGAVAIMKAINDDKLTPAGVILECPFGTLYQTVEARFKLMKMPSFPFTEFLIFWGGIQNGFWGFSHNPEKFAKSINCPSLIIWGEQDKKVSRGEIDEIYKNLNGKKTLIIYPEAGHDNYLIRYKKEWSRDVGKWFSINF